MLLPAAVCSRLTLVVGAGAHAGLTAGFMPGLFAVFAILAAVVGAAYVAVRLYPSPARPGRKRRVAAQILLAAVVFALMAVSASLLRSGADEPDAVRTAVTLGAWLACMIPVGLTIGLTVRRPPGARRVLLVGDPNDTDALVVRLRSHGSPAFDPVVLRPADISWPKITQLMLRSNRIFSIVVAAELDASTLLPLLDCKRRGMQVLSAAGFHEAYLGQIDPDWLTANDMLLGDGFITGRASDALKRTSDIILGLAMLLLTLPLMLATALAIKIDSPGQVFCREPRVGRFNQGFAQLKFRSVAVGDAAGPGMRRVRQRGERVTRVGRFIRASRIDELPQLLNVLRGEMSLVGPWAECPNFALQLASAIPFYRQRCCVRPGITGWAQINFPDAGSVEDIRSAVAYDLYYVKNRSLLLDMIILLKTVGIVLFRRNARRG